MGANSKVEWTTHTFNPWIGCAKVSEGCKFCYAEHDSPARISRSKGLELWGPNADRKVKAESGWDEPIKWDKAAAKAGERHRVFCLSQGDWLEDRPDLIAPRARLLRLIHDTPGLDWLLLTKRPENWAKVMRATIDSGLLRINEFKRGFRHWAAVDWLHGKPPKNVWLGVSVENQAAADERIPVLLSIPAKVRFLSVEPLLGPVDLTLHRYDPAGYRMTECDQDALRGTQNHHYGGVGHPARLSGKIDWVIVGGESGPDARPMHPDWARSLRDQCNAAGVPFFMKQMNKKDPIPDDLFIREFPNARQVGETRTLV